MTGTEPISIDLVALVREFGPFVVLVVFVLWSNHKREQKSNDRENVFIEETREREKKYIEREDKYIQVIESLTDSVKEISTDVSAIKDKLGV